MRRLCLLTVLFLLLPSWVGAHEQVEVVKLWCDGRHGVNGRAGLGHTPYIKMQTIGRETQHNLPDPLPRDECAVNEAVEDGRLRLRGRLQRWTWREVDHEPGVEFYWKNCRWYGLTVRDNPNNWDWVTSWEEAAILTAVSNPKNPPCRPGKYRLQTWHGRYFNGDWKPNGNHLPITTDAHMWE